MLTGPLKGIGEQQRGSKCKMLDAKPDHLHLKPKAHMKEVTPPNCPLTFTHVQWCMLPINIIY